MMCLRSPASRCQTVPKSHSKRGTELHSEPRAPPDQPGPWARLLARGARGRNRSLRTRAPGRNAEGTPGRDKPWETHMTSAKAGQRSRRREPKGLAQDTALWTREAGGSVVTQKPARAVAAGSSCSRAADGTPTWRGPMRYPCPVPWRRPPTGPLRATPPTGWSGAPAGEARLAAEPYGLTQGWPLWEGEEAPPEDSLAA